MLAYFDAYLEKGYYPFYKEEPRHYLNRIVATVNQVLGQVTAFLRFLGFFVCTSALAWGAGQGDVPLPEHPRPDWERVEWLNLNGEWDFGFAHDKFDRKILVPFGWGCPLSGVRDEGDTGYYRRSVTVPEAWKGRRVFVVVGASDHDTTCTFAGETLGKHVGGYTPFEYELTEFVRWGEAQTLEFKVWDPPAGAATEGHYLYGKQGYGNARGIWQTVYLEARGDVFLDSVRFTPSIAGKTVKCRAFLSAPAKSEMSLSVETAGKKFAAAVKPGDQVVDVDIRMEKPRLWTLDDPYLYDAKLALGDDEVKTYFGFREIGTGKTPNGDGYVTLNGSPVYLQMCLDQSYHPEGWYTFPSDEFMKEEIMISKRLALTGNRVHIKVEVPRKLYWADRLGVLIQADVPCAWGDASEAMFDEHWKCFEGMVKRDFNHPCIYQWTLFNETWGLFSNRSLAMGLASGNGGKKRIYREWTQRMVADAYRRAKEEDPTRLVEDNSPCNRDHVVTDVNTWHAYYPGYKWEGAVRDWCEKTLPGSRHNYIGGHVQGDAPMMNSECGNVWGYAGSTGDCDFTWDYHLMINAFRRHLKCAGWLYTEHHDVCNEWNGYVRFDRSPKYDGFDELAGMAIADFHRDAALFFAGRRGFETGEMLCPGQMASIPVGVSLVTDGYAGKTLALSVSSWHVDGEGRRVEGPLRVVGESVVARSWQCEKLWDVDFTAPDGPACGCVCMALAADGETVAKNFWSFGVTNSAPLAVAAAKSEWSHGTTNVLDGLKANGFGSGFFEFRLDAPPEGGVFRAEVSAKRKNGKDMPKGTLDKSGFDYMLGGGTYVRSCNPNSYPQTSDEKFASTLRVFVGGRLAKTVTLPDDPADSRGILSWLSQPHDGHLREAGSYGYLVEVDVPASAVKGGKVDIRLESDNGLAIYGPAFGRYPMSPHVAQGAATRRARR